MKFPFSMLLDFVRTSLSPEAVGDLLTMAGFELEGMETVEGDTVLDIKVCSNRGDGLSVLGLAREVLAKEPSSEATDLYRRCVTGVPYEDDGKPSGREIPVRIETEECDRFAYRSFAGVTNGTASEKIQLRLRQAGMRSISLFVDLTNYVMLEIGQPLHAYDLAKLAGPEIIVRKAKSDEKLTTLDGVERPLKSDQMMICDAQGPIGVAGVMGGAATEVDASTTEVLLEAAHFSNTSVRRTRKQLGLNTEASYRFERSVDPQLVTAGLNRVRELLEEAGHGAWVVPGVSDVWATRTAQKSVQLRLVRANRLLGMELDAATAIGYLERLGFTVGEGGTALTVEVPSWRFDVTREEDLVEELGRIHGYEKIPEWNPAGSTPSGGVFGRFLGEEVLVEAGLRLGYDQAMTHSLRGSSPLDAPVGKVAVRTPGSPDTSTLRNSLIPGLGDALRRNGGNASFIEVGPIFSLPFETSKSLALIAAGPLYPADRQNEKVPVADFASVKASLVELGQLAGEALAFLPSDVDPRLHPTRQAVVAGPGWRGVIGQIHPLVAEAADLPKETYMAEVHLPKELTRRQHSFRTVSRNPSVRRDIAFLIPKTIPYSHVEEAVRTALGTTLESVWLFDVYEGKGVPEGSHSLALALTLRKSGSTFTDEEANQEREKAVAALAALGATPR